MISPAAVRHSLCVCSVFLAFSTSLLPQDWFQGADYLNAADERRGQSLLRGLESALQQRQQQQNQGQNQNNSNQSRSPYNQGRFSPEFRNRNPSSSSNSNPPNQLNQGRHHWLNDAIQGVQHMESHEDRYDRDEVRMGRLWQQGHISHSQYEQLLDSAVRQIGSRDHDHSYFSSGWEQRNVQWQQCQQNTKLTVDQKKLGLEYVKYGDRPLEAEKGLVPKPNPVLSTPQSADTAEASRLAQSISDGLKDDLASLRKSLPEGCRIDEALALIEKLKAGGAEQELVSTLQTAMVERDVRRFERNAQALLVPAAETQRLLIGLTLENLQDKLEDNATSSEIAKITEPMVRRVDQAGLDKQFATSLAAWLQSIPTTLRTQQNLASGKIHVAKAWPNGQLQLVFDPKLTSGEARVLPGNIVATAGNGEPRIVMGSGDKYMANGLSVFKDESGSTAADVTNEKPEVPTLALHYPAESGNFLNYTIICFQEQPTEVPGSFKPVEVWRKEYSIKPGLTQSLPLARNGRTWYQINCRSIDGLTPDKAYTLKAPAGQSPTYAFSVAGNIVALMSTPSNVTLDNSRNARPFQFMLGNQYQTVRAGAKIKFDSGVTLQYARNGKTAVPKDATGKAIPNASPQSTDISTITLRGQDTGVIGINAAGDWEIRPGAAVLVAERKSLELPVVIAKSSEPAIQPVAGANILAPRGTLYVLAIGISKYQNAQQFPALSFADKDATVLSAVLQKQKETLFSDVQTVVLTNAEATAIKIRTELVGLERKATKNDTVALILSGHGVIDKESYYFCPHDTDRTKLERQGISCSELQKVTDNLSAKNVFVFLDSCYSGGATDRLQEGFKKQISRVGDSGVVIFASSKGSESSQEDKSWGHGALTKAFLDTIANPELDLNKDSILQVAELDRGLAEGVKRLTDGGQHLQSAELGDSIRNLSLVRLGE